MIYTDPNVFDYMQPVRLRLQGSRLRVSTFNSLQLRLRQNCNTDDVITHVIS